MDIVEGDIADAGVIERAVQGVATVYHLAAVYREAKHPDFRYREVNVDASRRLLDAAVAASVRRYVHCSTVGVHGHIASPPADEHTAYEPGDVYQETKCEAEQLALSYRDRIPLAVARPTAIYGPGDTRLLKMFRMVARAAIPAASTAGRTTITPSTSTIWCAGFACWGPTRGRSARSSSWAASAT